MDLADSLPKSGPRAVASDRNDRKGKRTVAGRGRADSTESPPQPGELKFLPAPSLAEHTVSSRSSTMVVAEVGHWMRRSHDRGAFICVVLGANPHLLSARCEGWGIWNEDKG